MRTVDGQVQREGDGGVHSAQRHHVAEVLVLERQQRAAVDGRPQVPPRVVRRLERHLPFPFPFPFGRE